MKALILGGSGMLGHKVYQKFKNRFDTYATFRDFSQYKKYNIFEENHAIHPFSCENPKNLNDILAGIRPDFVVNCIGITKHQLIADNPIQMITTNSLFPHILSHACGQINAKLILISTDCVFSGKAGQYKENDFSDADDLYGRTKYLGEVAKTENTLTIRTSIIGRELKTSLGLLEWFLSQKTGKVKGYKNAIFSGFTTEALSDILINIIEKQKTIYGLYNISADAINKFDLLNLINRIFKLRTEIVPFEDFYCDRSLNSSKFKEITGIKPLSWENMISNMLKDNEQYNDWRNL